MLRKLYIIVIYFPFRGNFEIFSAGFTGWGLPVITGGWISKLVEWSWCR